MSASSGSVARTKSMKTAALQVGVLPECTAKTPHSTALAEGPSRRPAAPAVVRSR